MNIDFTNKKQLLNENWLKMFGTWSKTLLKMMFGDDLQLKAKLNEDDEEEESSNFVIRGLISSSLLHRGSLVG